ncbi:hypothetical protein QJS66_03010 [Kocuria rhizophila]|nr:hypothetical protein QJS66_03010 [Kocuria rhizophila]
MGGAGGSTDDRAALRRVVHHPLPQALRSGPGRAATLLTGDARLRRSIAYITFVSWAWPESVPRRRF